MRAWWCIAATLLAGCVRDHLVPCGDRACPVGLMCIQEQLCATQEQVDACTGILDGETCMAGAGNCVLGTCVPSTCGDGQVTGDEVCDGDRVNITCEDLGFYHGTTGCKAGCSIDVGACTGFCGDSLVETAEGEECDSAPPPGQTCVGYGRDYGILACNRFCTPTIADTCRYFGWKQLLSANRNIREVAANARGAIALDTMEIRYSWNGLEQSTAKADYQFVLAAEDRFVATGPSTTAVFDGTAWTAYAVGVPARPYLGGTRLVSVEPNCNAEWLDLAATPPSRHPLGATTPVPTGCTAIVRGADDALYVAANTAGTWRLAVNWTASTAAWTKIDARTTTSLDEAAAGHFVGGKTSVGFALDTTHTPFTIRDVATLGYPRRAFDADANELALILDQETDIYEVDLRIGGLHVDRPTTPESPTNVTRAASGEIVIAGKGVFALQPQVTTAISSLQELQRWRVLDDDTFGYCTGQPGNPIVGWIHRFDTPKTTLYPASLGPCFDFVGDPRVAGHLVANAGGIYRYDPIQGYVKEIQLTVIRLAQTDTETLAMAAVGLTYARTNGSWPPLDTPTGCHFTDLGGNGGRVYAVAACTTTPQNQYYEYSSGAWTHAGDLPEAPRELAVARDGTPVFRFDTRTVIASMPPVVIEAAGPLSALSKTDVWISAPNRVVHFDGTNTSEIRLPQNPLLVLPRHIYSAAQLAITVIPRLPFSTSGTGL